MSEWIKCCDKLPQMDEPVLAWDGEYIEKAFRTDVYLESDGIQWIWTYYDYMEWKDVTHWMPLPKPPKE